MLAPSPEEAGLLDKRPPRFETNETNGSGRSQEAGSRAKILQSIAYMMHHRDQSLRVMQLAAVAHLSLSHYFALFKQVTGFAPLDFFIRLRMQHAGELLLTTEMTVKEIAAALGYDDPFYFSRVFKSVKGVAPRDYRRLEWEDKIRQAALPSGNGSSAAAALLGFARTVKQPPTAYA